MKILQKIKYYYQRIFWSYEKRARYAGVTIGKKNFISSHFWSSEPYLITVGSYCQITHGVKFFTHGGGAAVRDKYPKFDLYGKISIGDYVYIGNNSLIMPGCVIGNNVIIASGSVVTKSIPEGMVVGGNPARIICSIDDYIQRNIKYNLNSKGISANEKREMLLNLNEDKFIKKGYLKFEK